MTDASPSPKTLSPEAGLAACAIQEGFPAAFVDAVHRCAEAWRRGDEDGKEHWRQTFRAYTRIIAGQAGTTLADMAYDTPWMLAWLIAEGLPPDNARHALPARCLPERGLAGERFFP